MLVLTFLIETTPQSTLDPARVFQAAMMAVLIGAIIAAGAAHNRWMRGQ